MKELNYEVAKPGRVYFKASRRELQSWCIASLEQIAPGRRIKKPADLLAEQLWRMSGAPSSLDERKVFSVQLHINTMMVDCGFVNSEHIAGSVPMTIHEDRCTPVQSLPEEMFENI